MAVGHKPVVGNQEKSMKTEKTSIDRVEGLDMIVLDSSTGRLSRGLPWRFDSDGTLFNLANRSFSSWSVGRAMI